MHTCQGLCLCAQRFMTTEQSSTINAYTMYTNNNFECTAIATISNMVCDPEDMAELRWCNPHGYIANISGTLCHTSAL